MTQGEYNVEQQEIKDFDYLNKLNNDLKLFPNLKKTRQYQRYDAISDNAVIELKERCTTNRENPMDGESWAYHNDKFIEDHKLNEYSKHKDKEEWIYINIFTASASTNEELIFVYDMKKVIRKKLLNISKKPIFIKSMKGSDIPPHYEKRWLIDTEQSIKNKALTIYARSKLTGKYIEYTQEIYDAFIQKMNSKKDLMKYYDFPYDTQEERDYLLWNIFHF